MNDDVFFSRPCSKWEFFDKSTGLPIEYSHKHSWPSVHHTYNLFRRLSNTNDGDGTQYWASLHYTLSACHNKTKVYPTGETSHTVISCSLTLLRKIHEMYRDEINRTLNNHFRNFPDFEFHPSILQTCLAFQKMCKYVPLEGDKRFENARFFYYQGNDDPFKGFDPKTTRAICINSALGVTDKYYENAKKLLESFLSKKSSFEI